MPRLCHEFHDLSSDFVMIPMRGAAPLFLAPCRAMTPLAKALRESGKSDTELAKHLGVPRQYIGRWKKGKGARTGADFPREYAAKAASFLGVTAASLVGIDSPNPEDRSVTDREWEFLQLLRSLPQDEVDAVSLTISRRLSAGANAESPPGPQAEADGKTPK